VDSLISLLQGRKLSSCRITVGPVVIEVGRGSACDVLNRYTNLLHSDDSAFADSLISALSDTNDSLSLYDGASYFTKAALLLTIGVVAHGAYDGLFGSYELPEEYRSLSSKTKKQSSVNSES
jgi:hypothetical protein